MNWSMIFDISIKIAIVLISITLVGLVFNLLGALTSWLNTKSKREDLYIQLETNPNLDKKEHITFNTKIEVTVALLNIINILIDAEIGRTIENINVLGNKYELLKFDDDAKRISDSVFNAFNKEDTFLSNKLMITDAYIMKYIMEETITRLLRRVQEYNVTMIDNR